MMRSSTARRTGGKALEDASPLAGGPILRASGGTTPREMDFAISASKKASANVQRCSVRRRAVSSRQ